jgi:hypothetical protein
MMPEEVLERIGKPSNFGLKRGRMFYDFITANRLQTGLALGFSRFDSIACIVGGLQDIGFGSLTAIDLSSTRNLDPNLGEVLESIGLSHLVQAYYEPRSVNWRLMKMLEEDRYESFDFCYISGAPTWYEAGLSFCLVERLLKPGGWVVFDELHFTYRDSRLREKPWVGRMPEEEQTCPQVERVFELLVEADPHFCSFRRFDRLGFALKRYPVWSLEQRASNDEDLIVSRAITRAHFDPEYREELLFSPSQALSDLDDKADRLFSHLSFVDTDHFAPIRPGISDSGKTIIYLERPSWECTITEAVLQKMLED